MTNNQTIRTQISLDSRRAQVKQDNPIDTLLNDGIPPI